MTLIGKTIVERYIRKGIEFTSPQLSERKLKLTDAPVLTRGNAYVFLEYPLKRPGVDVQFGKHVRQNLRVRVLHNVIGGELNHFTDLFIFLQQV